MQIVVIKAEATIDFIFLSFRGTKTKLKRRYSCNFELFVKPVELATKNWDEITLYE